MVGKKAKGKIVGDEFNHRKYISLQSIVFRVTVRGGRLGVVPVVILFLIDVL